MGIPKWADVCEIEMTVIAGNDLVAKDRNLLGRKTTSDPYVEVYLEDSIILHGKTKTIYKNLNPEWNTKFKFWISDPWKVTLKIYDEDKMSSPDLMGVVTVNVKPVDGGDQTAWYEVPKDSAKNAKGKLQLRFKTKLLQPKRMVMKNGIVKLNPKYKIWQQSKKK